MPSFTLSRVRRLAASLAAVVLSLALGLYFWFAHDLESARARLTGKSQAVVTRFGMIEYAELGRGPAILISQEPPVASTKGWR